MVPGPNGSPPRAAHRVPIGHAEAKVVLHRLAFDQFVLVVVAECQRVLRLGAFVADFGDIGKCGHGETPWEVVGDRWQRRTPAESEGDGGGCRKQSQRTEKSMPATSSVPVALRRLRGVHGVRMPLDRQGGADGNPMVTDVVDSGVGGLDSVRHLGQNSTFVHVGQLGMSRLQDR